MTGSKWLGVCAALARACDPGAGWDGAGLALLCGHLAWIHGDQLENLVGWDLGGLGAAAGRRRVTVDGAARAFVAHVEDRAELYAAALVGDVGLYGAALCPGDPAALVARLRAGALAAAAACAGPRDERGRAVVVAPAGLDVGRHVGELVTVVGEEAARWLARVLAR